MLGQLDKLRTAELVNLLPLLHLDAQTGEGLQKPPLHVLYITGAVGDKAQLAVVFRKADHIFISCLIIFNMEHPGLILQELPFVFTHVLLPLVVGCSLWAQP